MQQEVQDNLEAVLREETGAVPEDPLPGLVAGQICWIHGTVFAAIGREMLKGRAPAEVSREMLVLVDDIEELLSDRVLRYAVRG